LAPTTPRPGTPQTRQRFRDGALEAVLDPRARTLAILDTATGEQRAHLTVGVGPTQLACAPQGPCFVVDTQGDALLVVRVGTGGRDTSLTRRVYLAGAPYAIALDPERRRLWITLTARNELVELGAHGRPHVLARHPTIQQPDAVAVDPSSGDVTITAPDGSRQRIRDPASADR
jgi:DNA-binding beta-propeller fold protein YncE